MNHIEQYDERAMGEPRTSLIRDIAIIIALTAVMGAFIYLLLHSVSFRIATGITLVVMLAGIVKAGWPRHED